MHQHRRIERQGQRRRIVRRGQAFFEAVDRVGELAGVVQRDAVGRVQQGVHPRFPHLLGRGRELLDEHARGGRPFARESRAHPTAQQQEELLGLGDALADLARPLEGGGDLRRAQALGGGQGPSDGEAQLEFLKIARHAVGQLRDQIEPALQVYLGLAFGAAIDGTLTGALPRRERGLDLAGCTVVLGEDLRMRIGIGRELLDQGGGHARVESALAALQQRVTRGLGPAHA